MSNLGELHRRYDGPVPTLRDPEHAQRSIVDDMQSLRNRAAMALARVDEDAPGGEAEVRRLRVSLAWYDSQIERIEGLAR